MNVWFSTKRTKKGDIQNSYRSLRQFEHLVEEELVFLFQTTFGALLPMVFFFKLFVQIALSLAFYSAFHSIFTEIVGNVALIPFVRSHKKQPSARLEQD